MKIPTIVVSGLYDPTYNADEIQSNPTWRLAFQLSEIFNDNAPVGWSKFIPPAERCLCEARVIGIDMSTPELKK